MLFVIKLGIKVAKSKTGRKIAKKAAQKIAENVEVSAVDRGIDVGVVGKKFRVDRSTFKRTQNASIEYVPTAWDLDEYA
jgi:hypothetical protein